MTASEKGFVQQHELYAQEGTLCQHMEDYLTKTYGKTRPEVGPGLRWLTGDSTRIEGWMDHPEYRIKDGKRTFIGRPYSLSLDQAERVVEIARAKGVRLLITCPSNYNLDTVLVILTEDK
jgi:hypothetical protein